MFKKLFKGGGNDFYLEMEEESKDAPSKPSQSPTTSNGNGAKSAAAVAPTPEAKPAAEAEKTEAEKTEVAAQDSGATRKKTFRQSKVAKKETAPASTPTPAPTPAPVAASPQSKEETDNTFAPKYLMPTSTNGRRRPGPNMNSFLEMASQVKVNTSKSTIQPKTIASSKAPTPVKTEAPEKSAKSAKSKKSEKAETN